MEIQVAVSKVRKWASRESGDTVEMIERPSGGLSWVLVDGQHTGRGAKVVSNLVARKAISLLAEGVRDGAAARAAHDYLYAQRGGKVQATLNIVSVDLVSRTVVLSRNNPNPSYVLTPAGVTALAEESRPVGLYHYTKPVIRQIPLAPETVIVVYTDGLATAGTRRGQPLNVAEEVERLYAEGLGAAQTWADKLLAAALDRDEQRPADDISILVLAVLTPRMEDPVRRMLVRVPL